MSLNLFGLKAQVLGRIEDLEARERQREELLTELTPRWRREDTTRRREGGAGRVSRSVESASASGADGFPRVVS
jgi:hypothetical protein